MTLEKQELLLQELGGLRSAAEHLAYSVERCRDLIARKNWTLEELERLESLTSRFSRLADLLIQRVMRLVDNLELTDDGTLLDRIFRAEKRGWADAAHLIKIRELRNLIAHEYANDKMPELYAAVFQLTPTLLEAIPKVMAHANDLVLRFPYSRKHNTGTNV